MEDNKKRILLGLDISTNTIGCTLLLEDDTEFGKIIEMTHVSPKVSAKITKDKDNESWIVTTNSDWLTTSYTTKNGNIMVWNGYILEIWWKKLTTKIIDHLLNCNDSNLENELKRFWLYEVLQETYKKAKQSNNNWNLFEQILANTDVKIIKRNLILKWKDMF